MVVLLNQISVFLAVKDDSKKGHYREKIKGYMDRAEQIKEHVNKLKEGNVVGSTTKKCFNPGGFKLCSRNLQHWLSFLIVVSSVRG